MTKPTIFIDADACPVKAEAEQIITRHQLDLVIVSNGGIRPSPNPLVQLIIVAEGPDVADKYIADIIQVHPYFLSNYKQGCSNYSVEDCLRIISVLKKYDLKFKGVDIHGSDDLLKDLIFDIIFF